MNAREMDAMAQRWERDNAATPRKRRTVKEARADAAWERWKADSSNGCIPCLLEEVE